MQSSRRGGTFQILVMEYLGPTALRQQQGGNRRHRGVRAVNCEAFTEARTEDSYRHLTSVSSVSKLGIANSAILSVGDS